MRFKWTAEAQKSFEILKEKLSQPPILVHPDFNKDFILSCDSSEVALGGTIGQLNNGIILPIAYFSKKLTPQQIKYSIMHKELLAIVESIKSFKYYLYGRHFIIKCDNKALTELSKLESHCNRVARWFTFLSDYNYTFEHIKSEENIIADTLSRDFFVDNNKNTSNSASNNATNNKNELQNIEKLSIQHANHTENSNTSENKSSFKYIKTNRNNFINTCQTDAMIQNSYHNANNEIRVGLKNLGNTCFMNVILQVLTHCPPFREYILNINTHDTNCKNTKNCTVCLMHEHVKTVLETPHNTVEPIKLYRNLNQIASHFQFGQQQDAHEFLYFFLEKLRVHDSTKHPTNISNSSKIRNITINEIFTGCMKSQLTCFNCEKSSTVFDTFIDFTLFLSENINTLEEALQDFMNPELLMNNNYRCTLCRKTVIAQKQNSIKRAPLVATFHVNRFNNHEGLITKNNNFLAYPNILDLSSYMTDFSEIPALYTLHAIIVHNDHSNDMGHYYCYIKDSNENWHLLNDSKVQRVNTHDILNEQAYILIYTKSQSTQHNAKAFCSYQAHINAVQIDIPSLQDIKSAQHTDCNISQIINRLKNPTNESMQRLKDYKLQNDLLMHTAFIKRYGKLKRIDQIVIPKKFRPHFLAAKHLQHFSLLKTYEAIREKYYWENLYSDVKNYIQSCKFCMEYKSPNKIPPVPIQRNLIPSRPMEFISADYIGKLPTTQKGNSYILTIIDHFSKFIKLYAVPNQLAITTAEKVLDFFCTFGIPEYFLTDKGTQFTSELFKILCKKFGVNKLFTTPLNPKNNGLSEKINASIKKSLSIFVQNLESWDNFLDFYALLYNSSLHNAINDKPAYIIFGFDPQLPTDIINEPRPLEMPSYADFVTRKTRELQYTYEKVRDNLIKSAEAQEAYQHKKAKYRNFKEGQLVYMYSIDLDRHTHAPKRRNYTGPFRIIKQHNKVNFTVINTTNPKAAPIKVNAHRLIPYTERRPDLNLLSQIVQNDQQNTEEEPDFNNIKKKPPPVFEELTETELLSHFEPSQNPPAQSCTHITRNSNGYDTNVKSPFSDSTEIYEWNFSPQPPLLTPNLTPDLSHYPTESTPLSSAQSTVAHNLRPLPHRGIGDTIINWGLRVTDPTTEEPAVVRFLDKLSNAMN